MADDLEKLGGEPEDELPEEPESRSSRRQTGAASRPTTRDTALRRILAPENRSKLVMAGGVLVLGLGGVFFLTNGSSGSGVTSKVNLPSEGTNTHFHSGQNSTPAYAHQYQKYQNQKAATALSHGQSYAPGFTQTTGSGSMSINVPKPASSGKPKHKKAAHFHASQYQTGGSQTKTQQPASDKQAVQYELTEMQALGNSFDTAKHKLSVDEYRPARRSGQASPAQAASKASVGSKSKASAKAGSSTNPSSKEGSSPALIGPGKLYYAVVDTSVDSDQPGTPVMATLEDGPLAHSRLLGNFTRHGDHLVIQFKTLTLPNQASFPIKAVATSPSTNRAAVESSYNNHDFSRYAWLVAGAFLRGVGNSASDVGTSVTSTLGGFSAVTSPRSIGQDALSSLGTVGRTVGNIGVQNFNRIKPTVREAKGHGIGILFLKPLRRATVEKAIHGQTAGKLPSVSTGAAAKQRPAPHLNMSMGGVGRVRRRGVGSGFYHPAHRLRVQQYSGS